MAITQRTGQINCWLVVGGAAFQCEEAIVRLMQGQTGNADVRLPLNAPGYYQTFCTNNSETECKITVLTADGEDDLCKGTIYQVTYDLIAGIIHVHVRDASAMLHRLKSFQAWTNKFPHDIVKDLVGQAGIPFKQIGQSQVMAGKKTKQDYVKLTDGQSFATVINKLAQFDGASWWIDPKTGGFVYHAGKFTSSATVQGPNFSLYWQQPAPNKPMNSDCLALEVKHDLTVGGTNGQTHSWDPVKKQVVQSGTDQPAPASGGGGGPMAGTGGLSGVNKIMGAGGQIMYGKTFKLDIPNLDKQQADQYANSAGAQTSNKELDIIAMVVGDPSAVPGMSVTLNGTGCFDQSFDCTEVDHIYSYTHGYTTRIVANNKNQGGGQAIGEKPGGTSETTTTAPQGGGASVPGAGTPL